MNNCYPSGILQATSPVTSGFYMTGFIPPYTSCQDYMSYYVRYFLLKVMSVLDFKFPDEWDFGLDDYFRYNLFVAGNIPTFYDPTHGFVAQWGAYEGRTLALRPEFVIISNEFFKRTVRKIGEDCVVFSLTPDYCGVYDKVCAYAEIAAQIHQAVKINVINSKTPIVFGVDDRKIAQDMAKMYDIIQSGETAVYSKNSGSPKEWNYFNPNTKSNYITDMLLSDMRKLMNMFNTDFGIPNANTDKKERLVTDEVNANNAETSVFMGSVLRRLQKCCDEVQRLFGKRYIDVDWAKEVKVDAQANTDPMGNVPGVPANSGRIQPAGRNGQ